MDERQKEAAERALHRVEMDELMKRIALRHRIDCINDVSFYGLPYRLLYDLEQSPGAGTIESFLSPQGVFFGDKKEGMGSGTGCQRQPGRIDRRGSPENPGKH